MEAGRCANCGRSRPGVEAHVDPASAPWASFDGRDLCPDCQTPHQRREATRRALAWVKELSQRRLREGIPAGDMERQLLLYVLAQQQALDAGEEPPAEGGAGEPSETPRARPAYEHDPRAVGGAADFGGAAADDPSGRRHSQVALTGAFVTGSEPVARIAQYSKLQEALEEVLSDGGWEFERAGPRAGTYKSGGGFTEAMPLVVAARRGRALEDRVRDSLKEPEHAPGAALAKRAPGYQLEPTSVRIDVYDLGVAVLTARFAVSAPATDSTARFTGTIKQLSLLTEPRSPLAESLRVIADETTAAFRRATERALPADEVQDSWLTDPRDIGRLLWLHPVHVVERAQPDERAAEPFAPVFHRTIKVHDGVFVPGIGWSAILFASGTDGAKTPVRLTQRHWAYYALYMQLDRGLLHTLNKARSVERPKRKDLEREAREAFDLYLRVMEARARLDSELSSLGGDERAIWDAIADVQHFDTIVDGVERKVEVLQKLTERRAEEAVDRRARRISEGLTWLTAATVLTATFAGVVYFVGARDPVSNRDAVRLWAFIGAAVFAVLIVLLAYWERRLPTRRSRRRHGGTPTDRPPAAPADRAK